MSIIKVRDLNQCCNVQAVKLDMAGSRVEEHVCILPKGHDCEHTDGNGRVWRDLDWLRRRIEAGKPDGKIFSFPEEKK